MLQLQLQVSSPAVLQVSESLFWNLQPDQERVKILESFYRGLIIKTIITAISMITPLSVPELFLNKITRTYLTLTTSQDVAKLIEMVHFVSIPFFEMKSFKISFRRQCFEACFEIDPNFEKFQN